LFTQNEIFEYHQSQEKILSARKEVKAFVKQFEEDKSKDIVTPTMMD